MKTNKLFLKKLIIVATVLLAANSLWAQEKSIYQCALDGAFNSLNNYKCSL